MDVHTGETTRSTSDPSATVADPSATLAVPSVGGADQGRLFNDPGGYSFADTDQLPAVPRERRNARPYGAPRWLRFALVAVVVVILAAGAALGLVKAGVIGKSTSPPATGQSQSHSTTPPTAAPRATKDLLTPSQTFNGGVSASYTIPAKAFAVTVTAGPGISWVTIGIVGQAPIYQGILQPHTSQREILLGAAEVSVGAGGTTVKVTSGHKSQTLLPPSAPYSIQITPNS